MHMFTFQNSFILPKYLYINKILLHSMQACTCVYEMNEYKLGHACTARTHMNIIMYIHAPIMHVSLRGMQCAAKMPTVIVLALYGFIYISHNRIP